MPVNFITVNVIKLVIVVIFPFYSTIVHKKVFLPFNMMLLTFVGLLVIVVASENRIYRVPQNLKIPNHHDGRILGGIEVNPPYTIPYQVSFQINGQHKCGGIIIDELTVLTVADCCYFEEAFFARITAGEHSLSEIEGFEQDVQVEEFIIHEGYDFLTNINNVCLLKLLNPLLFNDKVSAVTLPEKDEIFSPGTIATISGWGSTTSESDDIVDKLHSAEVTITTTEECQKYYDLTADMICAGGPGVDFCFGDKGGPMTCGQKLCGIAAIGNPCLFETGLDVFVEVSIFIDWINLYVKRV